jgi:signal transduction histidine kinase
MDVTSNPLGHSAMRGIGSGLQHPVKGGLFRGRVLLLLFCCLLYGGCRPEQSAPSVEFTTIPLADRGGAETLGAVGGRVSGARPGQRIVLYARSGAWYVQPLFEEPFTGIQPDSTWRNTIHLGTEYAALLVEPDYVPPSITDVLPKQGGAVVAVAVTEGTPVLFWQRRWFRVAAGLVGLFALLALYRYRLRSVTRQLNVRFEERLAERTRIAQELHDTLLQGVLSASMQLHVAVDNLPADAPARAQFGHVQRLMGQVIEEGRNAVRGLRSGGGDTLSLEQALSRVSQELSADGRPGFRVVVEGRPRPLHPAVRDEVYRIGHEALVNALRHSRANNIEVGVEYVADSLRLLVSDDGVGIDPQVLRAGRDGHWGLSGMRERAERLGARLKVRSRAAAGTEVELDVPGRVAFRDHASPSPRRWLARLRTRKASGLAPAERGNGGAE